MAFQDITNALKRFRLHVDIDKDYATLRSAKVTFIPEVNVQLKMHGCKALDLWTDGALYPKDPFSQQSPPFHNITNLLGFVENGFDCLLGYYNRLWSAILQESTQIRELEARYKEL